MRVLVCDAIGEDGVNVLRKAGLTVDVQPDISPEQLKQDIANYEVLLVRSRTKVTNDVIKAGDNLKIVARAGVGLDNVDVEAAEKRRIIVLNAPEAATNGVAELVIGLILALWYKIPETHRSVRTATESSPKSSLRDKALGVVGFGRIGYSVASKAKCGLSMRLLVYDPKISEDRLKALGAQRVDLAILLSNSDVVTIHVPSTPETKSLIGAKEMVTMKAGSIIINTSRGGVVDEAALYDALKAGRLSGAGLDVFEVEPPQDHSLLKLSNMVCTPHIGAQTLETQSLVSKMIAEKILGALGTK